MCVVVCVVGVGVCVCGGVFCVVVLGGGCFHVLVVFVIFFNFPVIWCIDGS